MAGIDCRLFRQGEELFADAPQQGGLIAAGKVRPADGAVKEGVAGEDHIFRRIIEGNATGGVARRLAHVKGHAAQGLGTGGQVGAAVVRHGRKAPDAAPDGFGTFQTGLVTGCVDRSARLARQLGHTIGMVKVSVRQADGGQGELAFLKIGQHGRGIAAHVNGNGLFAGMHDVAVGLQGAKGKAGNGHGRISFFSARYVACARRASSLFVDFF